MNISVPDERGFVFTNAFPCVGLGPGAAVGATVARPDRLLRRRTRSWRLPDGVAELETLVRHRLPVAVIVYTDEAYGAEVHRFGLLGHDADLTRFAPFSRKVATSTR